MAEYLSPGVFVEERPAAVSPIQGVSTSTYATCGWLQRGPVGVATFIDGFDSFVNKFGSYWTNSYVPYELVAFFSNGGSRAYVVREVPSDAVKASCSIESAGVYASLIGWKTANPIVTLDATHYNIKLTVDSFAATTIDVTGDVGVGGSYALSTIVTNINAALALVDPSLSSVCSLYTAAGGNRLKFTSPTASATSKISFTAPAADDATELLLGLPIASYPHTVDGAAAVNRWDITAENEGAWGNLIKVEIVGNDDYLDRTNGGWTKFTFNVYEESSLGAGDYALAETIGPVNLTVSTDPDYIEDVVNSESSLVRIAEGTTPGVPWQISPRTIASEHAADGTGALLTFSGYALYPQIVRGTFSVTDGAEVFTDNSDGTLTGDAGGTGTIVYTTGAWSVTFNVAPGSGDDINLSYKQQAKSTSATCTLTSGADGTGPLTRAEVTDPTLEASMRGIYAFNKIEEILNVSLPDFAGSVTIANDLISWAEDKKDKYIILDPAIGMTPQEVIDYRRYTGNFNTSYAALYYPWITIADPLSNNRPKNIPGSGFVAGVFARTDQQRNVSKAPAGVSDGAINGAIGVERVLSKGERDILYPANINPIADTPQTGRAVWGARALSLLSEWRYVQVRRLFMFVEKSVFLSTHWAVFENNGPTLWSKINLSLTSFLLRLHSDGYFAGTKPSESFRVVCDNSNNPQANIDAGIMTCDVYIAPNKPGEFIRFRFSQKVNNG